jgi:superfamily II DNA or RNA helicase
MAETGQDQSSSKVSAYEEDIVRNSARNAEIAAFLAEKVLEEGLWPGLVFVRWKLHGELLAPALASALGTQSVPLVTADVYEGARDALAETLRRRDPATKVVVVTDVWSTGIDIPSLRWGALVGEGQAPVGLLQRAGRSVRASDGKPDFTLFDFRTIGTQDDARYAEQAAKREVHFQRAGYEVQVTPQLQQLLEQKKEEKSARAEAKSKERKAKREQQKREQIEQESYAMLPALLEQSSISPGFAAFLVIVMLLGGLANMCLS